MKLPTLTCVVSGNPGFLPDTHRAAIRPHQCVAELLHPPLPPKTAPLQACLHPPAHAAGFRLKVD